MPLRNPSQISALEWNQDEEYGGFGGPHCMVVGGCACALFPFGNQALSRWPACAQRYWGKQRGGARPGVRPPKGVECTALPAGTAGSAPWGSLDSAAAAAAIAPTGRLTPPAPAASCCRWEPVTPPPAGSAAGRRYGAIFAAMARLLDVRLATPVTQVGHFFWLPLFIPSFPCALSCALSCVFSCGFF